jgi:mycofactocin system FadH/OYE family oxidoreductase 2
MSDKFEKGCLMVDHLFTSLKMGPVTLSNRFCFLAHRTNFGRKGRLNDRHIAYYRRRAQGECGLIILGELSIHPNDHPWEGMIETYHPDALKDFQRLTDTLHASDTPVFAQLNHHGFQSNGARTRRETWGPSAVADVVFGEVCKPMEPEDITELVDAFSEAARRVKAGGFDGIEIDMGPESLLRQFLSPMSNHRQDEFGGSLKNRMRFAIEVINGVRGTVGSDFAVGVRLCVDERFWGGITPQESLQVAQILEASGQVDFIQATLGTYYNLYLIMASMHTPSGFTIELAEQLKSSVKLPVIAGYQIEFPQMAEQILADGKADAAGCIRSLVCDPDMVKKIREGRPEDIRMCVRDNQGCIGRVNQSKTIGCILNPQVGDEPMTAGEACLPAEKKKKVAVIGAGPAGMEVGRIAHERGHQVTVYEREKRVGGQLNLAVKGAGRHKLGGVTRYLKHMLDKFNVPVMMGVPVTPDLIEEQKPDAVVVATGSVPVDRPYAGDYGPPGVLNVRQVLNDEYPVGEKVLFIDENSGHHATATVEYLADQSKKVDMITAELFIGIELAPLGDLYLSRQRLLQKGVTFTTDVHVDEIQGTTVKARNVFTHLPIIFEGYDTVILDTGSVVNDRLYRELKDRVQEIYRIGDCVAPRGIDMAIFEGRRIGEKL